MDGLPEDPKARAAALQELVATQEKLDKVIEDAKGKITTPDKVAITRMASEEARTLSSARTKAMQEALPAAKLEEEGKTPRPETSDSKPALGLSALRAHAEKKTSGTTGIKKGKEKKSSGSLDLAKIGKHLLR